MFLNLTYCFILTFSQRHFVNLGPVYTRVNMRRIYIDTDNVEFTQDKIYSDWISFTLQQLPSFMNCIQVKIYPNHTVYTRRTGKRVKIHSHLL